MKKRKPRTLTLPNTEGIPRTGILYRQQVMKLFGVSKTKLRDLMIEGSVPDPRPLEESPYKGVRIWDAPAVWEAHRVFFGIREEAVA